MMIPAHIAARGARRYGLARGNSSWLITFADMAILMVAFFAVIISFSTVNGGKFESLSDVMGVRFGGQKPGSALVALLPQPATIALPPIADLDLPVATHEPAAPVDAPSHQAMSEAVLDDLARQFEPLLSNAEIEMQHSPQKIVISLGAAGFFASGSAELDPKAVAQIVQIARIAGTAPVDIAVEGHADSKPISGGRYRDNWELAAARAAAVLKVLADHSGLPLSTFKIVSFGASRPAALETDMKAAARNRRVDIEITSR